MTDTSEICCQVRLLGTGSVVWFSPTSNLIRCAWIPAPASELDVLFLAKGSLRNDFALMELRLVLTNNPPEAESRMTVARQMEERMHVAGEDFGAHFVARACVDELTAERPYLLQGLSMEM